MSTSWTFCSLFWFVPIRRWYLILSFRYWVSAFYLNSCLGFFKHQKLFYVPISTIFQLLFFVCLSHWSDNASGTLYILHYYIFFSLRISIISFFCYHLSDGKVLYVFWKKCSTINQCLRNIRMVFNFLKSICTILYGFTYRASCLHLFFYLSLLGAI